MSRFILLAVYFVWMSWTSHDSSSPPAAVSRAPAENPLPVIWFFSGYLILILLTAVWSRRMVRTVDADNFDKKLRRYDRVMSLARLVVPIWFFAGVYFLGWGNLVVAVQRVLRLNPDRLDFPGLLLGTIPALAAWVGLWWSQYPADLAFREQSLLSQIDAGFPVHQPPPLGSYLRANLRLQLFFTVAPVMALVALRDLLSLALAPFGLREQESLPIQLAISLITAAVILLFAPEFLRRVLKTEPLPEGPLRQRLVQVCRRHNIRFRDVLLWRTDYNMGNAAVMGMIPQVRYILMSDLLLETMTDDQIEAVFAHEIGHVIHRHMLWFAVFFGAVMFAMVGLTAPLSKLADRWTPDSIWPAALATLAASAGCLFLFLFLSRKFERQADVFAARTIQADDSDGSHVGQPLVGPPHVGSHGAMIFTSALNQVARINCIPVDAFSACHGSIAKRMEYLQSLCDNPVRTMQFDRFMSRLNALLLLCLCSFGVWAMLTLFQQQRG